MVASHNCEDLHSCDDQHSEAASYQSVANANVQAWVQAHFGPDGQVLPLHENEGKGSFPFARDGSGEKTQASCASAFLVAWSGFKSRGSRNRQTSGQSSESHGFLSGAPTICGSV